MVDTSYLFALMEERGVTQNKLSEVTGISQGNIAGWKSGKTKPSSEALVKVAAYFEVPVDCLVGRVPKDSPLSSLLSKKDFLEGLLFSTPLRMVTIPNGNQDKIKKLFIKANSEGCRILTDFLNCEESYLYGASIEYIPAESLNKKIYTFPKIKALMLALYILDHCASDKPFRIIQQQISRIVLYNLRVTIDNDSEEFCKKCGIEPDKVIFLTDLGNFNQLYWLTFSDIMRISLEYDVTPMYMFTGQD